MSQNWAKVEGVISVVNDPFSYVVISYGHFTFRSLLLNCLLVCLFLVNSDDCTCLSTLINEPSKHCCFRPNLAVITGQSGCESQNPICPPRRVQAGGFAKQAGHPTHNRYSSCNKVPLLSKILWLLSVRVSLEHNLFSSSVRTYHFSSGVFFYKFIRQ